SRPVRAYAAPSGPAATAAPPARDAARASATTRPPAPYTTLFRSTAQLSQIPLEPPPSVLGRNTMETMQSGLVLGHMCMIEGLIDRMKQEMNSSSVKTIATGGLSKKVGRYTNYFDVVDPMLTLDGLRLIMDRQQSVDK